MTITAHLNYLQRQAFCPLQVYSPPDHGLGMVIVIPCHNEPDLISSLNALWECQRPECSVEVIVVINAGSKHPEEVHQQNQITLETGQDWLKTHNEARFRTHFLYFPDLPKKHAGVGLARKIGMDEAVGRLAAADREDAPIVCFDADALCEPNYLVAIEKHFRDHPKTPACSIHYEHPLGGDLPPLAYEGIIGYELYLRYYVEGLRYAGHPHAYHTIGSSMAARSSAYQAQGGMNRRKAGEDFHFLQKMIPLGGFTEIRNTKVIPSPRLSDRVPFGTGKAITDWVANPDFHFPVYAVEIFEVLKTYLDRLKASYGKNPEHVRKGLAAPLLSYLDKVDFDQKWEATVTQTKSEKMFFKRFFRWFNGLEVLHCVHFLQGTHYPDAPVVVDARRLLELHREGGAEWALRGNEGSPKLPEELKGLLLLYRKIQSIIAE